MVGVFRRRHIPCETAAYAAGFELNIRLVPGKILHNSVEGIAKEGPAASSRATSA